MFWSGNLCTWGSRVIKYVSGAKKTLVMKREKQLTRSVRMGDERGLPSCGNVFLYVCIAPADR